VVTECQDKRGLRGLYRRFWYVPDLILVVLLLCYGTFVHTSCLREYIGGLENTGLPMFVFATVKDWESTGWPLAIKSLRPHSLELHRDSANRPMVRLAWCGFDDAWGVAIGSEDMEIPKTQPPPPVKVGDRTFYEGGEYRLPLAPGVYVWRDIR
jgi:hypothetical protein